MPDLASLLERESRSVEPPEPAMDRLLRRQERKQRNERIAAAVVGLGVAAAGIVGAVVTLRVAEGTRPASGGDAARAAADTGGFVLPTVAIWTAIVVLGLTVLAAVRLPARFADVDQDVDVERGGRGRGGAAASARRPAAVPGTAPRGGGSQMDSKPKTGTGIPQAEMQPIRLRDEDAGQTSHGLRSAVIVLALSVLAIGALLVVSTQGEDVVGVPDWSRWPVEEFTTALSRSDGVAAANLFAEDGIYRVTDGTAYEGKAEIARFVDTLPPIDYTLVGDLSGDETRVTATFSYASPQGSGTLVRDFVFVGDDLVSVTDSEA